MKNPHRNRIKDSAQTCSQYTGKFSEMQPVAAADTQLPASGSLIQLHRISHVADRFGSTSFLFILPSALLRGFVSDARSRDFLFGGLNWIIQFERIERHLAAHLVLQRPAPCLSATVDFTFSLLNREHFTKNESFAETSARFSAECPRRGRAHYITFIDMQQRSFVFDNQTALLEVEMRNLQVVVSQTLQMPSTGRRDSRARLDCTQENKLDTGFFHFGGCEWNAVLHTAATPTAAKLISAKSGGIRVLLQRHSFLDSWCKIRYQVALTYDIGTAQQSTETSRVIDECVEGSSFPQQFSTQLGTFRTATIEIRLMTFSWITDILLYPTRNSKAPARLYDIEGQQWMVDCDLLGTFVKLRIYYIDIKNIPRASIRAVRWNAFILPPEADANRTSQAIISTRCGSLQNFYVQREIDDGSHMLMDVLVEKLLDKSDYIDADSGALRVRIEWLASYLLHNDSYTLYDSLTNEQRLQTKREMLALQAENYSLEKQIFMYQQAIAKCHARCDSPSVQSNGNSIASNCNHSVSSLTDDSRANGYADSPHRLGDASTSKLASINGSQRRRSASPCPIGTDLNSNLRSMSPQLNVSGPETMSVISAPAGDNGLAAPPERPSSRSSSITTLNRMLPRLPDENGPNPSSVYAKTLSASNMQPRNSLPVHRQANRTTSCEPQNRALARASMPHDARKGSLANAREAASMQRGVANAPAYAAQNGSALL